MGILKIKKQNEDVNKFQPKKKEHLILKIIIIIVKKNEIEKNS